MRDDQKRALLADGGKGEAVYQYKVRDLSGWHDCDAGAYERITTNMPEHVEARTLFTAPQAIGKGEAVAKVANFMFKGVKPTSHVTLLTDELLPDGTLLYTAPQAECAPREAQPVVEAMQAYLRQCRAGGMPKDVSDQIERAVNQANHLGYFAAPTPERAQESAGVLTDERIRAIADQYLQWGKVMYINANLNSIVTFARAVIAADKEPQDTELAKK